MTGDTDTSLAAVNTADALKFDVISSHIIQKRVPRVPHLTLCEHKELRWHVRNVTRKFCLPFHKVKKYLI